MNKRKQHLTICIKSLTLVFLIIFIFVSNQYFLKIKSGLAKERKEFSTKSSEYRAKLDNFQNKTQDIKESLEIWKRLGGENAYFLGVQIGHVKKTLDLLKDKYLFKELEIKMSKPIIKNNLSKNKIIAIEYSSIDLKIRAYSDTDIMLFLFDLYNYSPGYLIIESYFINKESSLDRVIEKLRLGQNKSSAVYANIKLYWKELKTL